MRTLLHLFTTFCIWFVRCLPVNALVMLETSLLLLVSCYPHLWVTWVSVFTGVLIVLLFPLNNIPLWYIPLVIVLFVYRKIRAPRLKAHLVPQTMKSEDAVLHDGRFFFFAVELIIKNPTENTIADLVETVSLMMHQKNSLQFTDITLVTTFTVRGEQPTYRLCFYVDLAENLDYLKARSQIPTATIFTVASTHISNSLAPLNMGIRFLTCDDLTDIATELIPTSEKPTYITANTRTWTFYTSNSNNIWQIVEKLTYPAIITQRFYYRKHKIVRETFIAASDARGSVTPRTRLHNKGAVYRIRFQQYPILTWFIPTTKPYTVYGTVSVR